MRQARGACEYGMRAYPSGSGQLARMTLMNAVHPATSLRERPMAGLVLTLVVWSLLSSAVAYLLARHFTTQAHDRSLHASILDIGRQLKLIGGQPAIALPPAALEMLEWNELDRVYYRVVTAGGLPIAGDAQLDLPALPVSG